MAHSLPSFTLKGIKYLLMISVVILTGYSCTTTGEVKEGNNNTADTLSSENREKYSKDYDLTMHLRKINGIRVTGDGQNAIITVRDADVSTFNASTRPLFVINGQVIHNNYSVVYNMVNRNQIKDIEVLKGAEAARYGIQGSNGVIVIELM